MAWHRSTCRPRATPGTSRCLALRSLASLVAALGAASAPVPPAAVASPLGGAACGAHGPSGPIAAAGDDEASKGGDGCPGADGEHVLLLQTRLSLGREPRGAAAAEARLAGGGATAAAATARQPHGPSQAFVHLFEWSWDDVAKECEEWLGPKGFAAVQISPPNEHVTGSSWYTRYQPVTYNLTSRSGNESQFVAMVQRCQAAGVSIYADAVFNHCAGMSGVGVAGSRFGSRTYPLYGPEDFHHKKGDGSTNCEVSNYHDQYNVQYCDLQGMPDLCTGCPSVQEKVAAYINHMAQLGVAGIRVDAAKHMNSRELDSLWARVNGSLFRFQEVYAVPNEVVQTPTYLPGGHVTEFGYAASLGPKFSDGGKLRDDLAKLGEDWGLMPSSKAVVFLDNHDTQRNGQALLTHKSGELYTLANMFMLAYPYGYPMVMSSFYFDSENQGPPSVPVHGPGAEVHCGSGQPWVCEHRLAPIANMVAWRRAAGESPVENFVSDGNTLAFCRGSVACLALNRNSVPWDADLHFSLPVGDYCNIAQSDAADCPRVSVAAGGAVRVQVPPKAAVALHIGAYRSAEQHLPEDAPLPPEDDGPSVPEVLPDSEPLG